VRKALWKSRNQMVAVKVINVFEAEKRKQMMQVMSLSLVAGMLVTQVRDGCCYSERLPWNDEWCQSWGVQ
jgi:hypothetical protein